MRQNDARENMDKLLSWLERDLASGSTRVFNFLHLFDLHNPHWPPLPTDQKELDLSMRRERLFDFADDYIDIDRSNVIDNDRTNLYKAYYEESVRYTAKQVDRLVRRLKQHEIFSESLIIITGDHGHEFYGTAKNAPTKTLYDDNIRQGMLIKPPKILTSLFLITSIQLTFFQR
jgi:arylsulfatase A-like enzyme